MIWALALLAHAEPEVRNRLSTGVIGEVVHHVEAEEGTALEVLLSDTLYARLLRRDDLTVELRFAGRAGIRLQDGKLDRARLRDLSVRLLGPTWQVDVGRFAPEGGTFRLVDGGQFLWEAVPGLRVGAWGGTGPDPYTTLPAARFGGGPILSFQHDAFEVSFLGEALATPDGLDRLSAVVRARAELGKFVEVGGHLDVQRGPAPIADARVQVRVDPVDDLRADVGWDAWSSISYLQPLRDPWITRFQARATALQDDRWIPQDQPDPSTYHQVWGRARWRPAVGKDGVLRLNVGVNARYRHHPDPFRRLVRGTVSVGVMGLLKQRVDVSLSGSAVRWGDTPAAETSGDLRIAFDPQGRLALDMRGTFVLTPLEGSTAWGPSLYVDTFVDWLAPKGVTLSIGYSYTNSQDIDRWSTYHGLIGRVSWRFDTRKRR